MYSDKINNPNNIDEKITKDRTKYFGFENTSLSTDVI